MSASGPIWMRLRSGLMLDLLAPSPHGWTDEDLAVRLSRTYRWSSDSRWDRPLSVAQHSLSVLHLRESWADRPLTPEQRLRELLHDADEGLFQFDALSPLKSLLGDGYQIITKRLRRAIETRYDLPSWDRASYQAHKRADRIAAASEAKYVVGWSDPEIKLRLGIVEEPLTADPLPSQPGLLSWEPWPARLAARLFLERLTALQREMLGAGDEDEIAVLSLHGEPERAIDRPWLKPTFVVVEGGCETVEGQIVRGVRDEAGEWDLDGVFTVQTEDGELIRVNGWACITEIL